MTGETMTGPRPFGLPRTLGETFTVEGPPWVTYQHHSADVTITIAVRPGVPVEALLPASRFLAVLADALTQQAPR